MKLIKAIWITAAAAALCIAQEPPQGGPPAGQRQMQPYDAAKEETFKAKVTDVKEAQRGSMTMVTLVVKIDDKDYEVQVGTPEFLKEKKFAFAKDDALSIKGTKTETPRGLRLRAREITKGKDALILLDKEGRPVWMQRPG
jgi:hypothetical protein